VVEIDPIEPAIADYLASFRAVRDVADFVVVNVSSPNTKGLRALQGPEIARALLTAIAAEREAKPVLLKIAPDLEIAELEALLEVVEATGIDGVVATNTTIRRDGLATAEGEVAAIGAGGLSGPPIRARAKDFVRRIRARLGRSITVIGVGGIETAHDVLSYVRAGADLVQLYTGFVYGGPGLPRKLARELGALVRREGARTVSELVGSDG
jgi:dihydroorotate dehydrogenase